MLYLKDISFAYGEYPCLEHVSLKIKGGECIAIIGLSGNDKTSIIRAINGSHDYELVNSCCTHYFNLSEEGDYEMQENLKKELNEVSVI